jgi:hypothetical protein
MCGGWLPTVCNIVEVAFDANIELDEQVLALGGSIAIYATGNGQPVTLPAVRGPRLYCAAVPKGR